MPRSPGDQESWKGMVLRAMPRPAWLSPDAPHSDVVLSSRTRLMRNLLGLRFPHRATEKELDSAMRRIVAAAEGPPLKLESFRGLTNAERDYFVGCRLLAPDFQWTLPSRALLVDRDRMVSVMVNEEDHLRIQAVTAGWSVFNSDGLAGHVARVLERHLEWARNDDFGYLAASPFNCGAGRRQSAMFHLIGLAHAKRLPAVMKALATKNIAVRGLFGESSRAIGAFAQVSTLSGSREEFAGACEYLIREEREARNGLGYERLAEKAHRVRDFAISQRGLSLADSLRVLGWTRWAENAGVPEFCRGPRAADEALSKLEIRTSVVEEEAAKRRADLLRAHFA